MSSSPTDTGSSSLPSSSSGASSSSVAPSSSSPSSTPSSGSSSSSSVVPSSSTTNDASSSPTAPPSESSSPPSSSTPPPTSSSPPPSSPPPSSSTPPPTSSAPSPSPSSPPPSSSTPPPSSAPESSSFLPSSTSSSSSAISSPASTSSTTFTTAVITTAPNGVVTTVIVETTQVISPNAPSSGGSSSNTGAIVGGVVGGVGGLLALLLLFWFWRRRHRRDDFDGNFDPDRVVRHSGNMDLVGAEVTPYAYEPAGAGAGQTDVFAGPGQPGGAAAGTGSMRQYQPDGKALLATGGAARTASPPMTASQYAPTTSDPADYRSESSHYPPTSHSSYPVGAAGANEFRHPSPGPSLPSSGSATTSSHQPRQTKEREALAARNGRVAGALSLANAEEGHASGFIQHQDGGRVAEEPEPEAPQEIPPSYDSIPADSR